MAMSADQISGPSPVIQSSYEWKILELERKGNLPNEQWSDSSYECYKTWNLSLIMKSNRQLYELNIMHFQITTCVKYCSFCSLVISSIKLKEQSFKVSQYRKCTLTHIRIHFINKNWPIHSFSRCFHMKIRFIWIRAGRNLFFVILHNNSTEFCFTSFQEERWNKQYLWKIFYLISTYH